MHSTCLLLPSTFGSTAPSRASPGSAFSTSAPNVPVASENQPTMLTTSRLPTMCTPPSRARGTPATSGGSRPSTAACTAGSTPRALGLAEEEVLLEELGRLAIHVGRNHLAHDTLQLGRVQRLVEAQVPGVSSGERRIGVCGVSEEYRGRGGGAQRAVKR